MRNVVSVDYECGEDACFNTSGLEVFRCVGLWGVELVYTSHKRDCTFTHLW